MGWIMKGIADNPIIVTVHLRAGVGNEVTVRRRIPFDIQHSRLMVKPGIATEAKPCHSTVSKTARLTRFRRSDSLDHDCCNIKTHEKYSPPRS